MNAQTSLPIKFPLASELKAWFQPIKALGGRSSAVIYPTAARQVFESSRTAQPAAAGASRKAALRIAPSHCRYVRRRIFAPNHTFEHRLP